MWSPVTCISWGRALVLHTSKTHRTATPRAWVWSLTTWLSHGWSMKFIYLLACGPYFVYSDLGAQSRDLLPPVSLADSPSFPRVFLSGCLLLIPAGLTSPLVIAAINEHSSDATIYDSYMKYADPSFSFALLIALMMSRRESNLRGWREFRLPSLLSPSTVAPLRSCLMLHLNSFTGTIWIVVISTPVC